METNVKQVFLALLKAKKDFKPILKTKTNPHFKSKYADLESIFSAIGDSLLKNELIILQPVKIVDGINILKTIAMHSSGEFFESEMILKSPDDTNPQKIGASLTYLKRYLLCGLLGIVADEDTDGEGGGSEPKQRKTTMTNTSGPSPASNVKLISAAQQTRLYTICTNAGWSNPDAKSFLKSKGFTSSKEIPSGRPYDEICKYIEEHPVE